jgi:hypothetical protein
MASLRLHTERLPDANTRISIVKSRITVEDAHVEVNL